MTAPLDGGAEAADAGRRIDDLRAFEREYRARIVAYLRALLRDLGDDPDSLRDRARDLAQRYEARVRPEFHKVNPHGPAPGSCNCDGCRWMRSAAGVLAEVAGG